MKNLHDIQPDFPLWVKQLCVAWFAVNGTATATNFYYDPVNDAFDAKFQYGDPSYISEIIPSKLSVWLNRGWEPYMEAADISKFDPSKIRKYP